MPNRTSLQTRYDLAKKSLAAALAGGLVALALAKLRPDLDIVLNRGRGAIWRQFISGPFSRADVKPVASLAGRPA